MSKKTRGANFSSNEKEILIHLVTKHKDVVENKKTDAVTTAIKNQGWRKLTEEFNSLSSFNVRATEQLKTCWDNIKRNTRKDKASTKKQIFLTGGGRPDLPPPGLLQDQVELLLGPTLDGLENEFDSDAQFLEQETANQTEKFVATEIEVIEEGSTDTTAAPTESAPSNHSLVPEDKEKKVWDGWSPAALKTKVSDTLSVKRRENPSSSWIHRRRPKTSVHEKLVQSKLELVELMKKTTEREFEIKQEILKEQLKQEKIKTEILQVELSRKLNS